jgi:hypothetical protein
MPQPKPMNPFYVALLPVGLVFVVTACAYVVMAMRTLNPHLADEAGLVSVMKHHGVMIMVIELALLGAFTVAAIASDDFWVRRFEAASEHKRGELP